MRCTRGASRVNPLLWTIVSLFLFAFIEAAIFRTDWYVPYLEPGSSAGSVESRLYWLSRPDPAKVPEILVVGDSRMAEGFSTRVADAASNNSVHYWSLGIPGTTPRVWYYELRDADPTRRRFQKIAIAIDQYADVDSDPEPADFIVDLNFAIERLRLTDCVSFANSMLTFDHKERAFAGCLFKGVTLRSDLQAFLHDRADRINRADDWRKNGLIYTSDYPGRSENLAGLTIDFDRRAVSYPPGLLQLVKDQIRRMELPDPFPQTGDLTRYRKLWFGRILDLYKDSPTQIVFFELARGPVSKPDSTAPATWLHEALAHPRVSALPKETFRDLEHPELFFDGLHFNKDGRRIFSERLARLVEGTPR